MRLLWLLCSATTVRAYSFLVKQPSVKRFVKITSDNVNLRRLPNTNSGKLMSWNSDGGSFETYTKIFFSDTEGSKYRANNMTGAYVDTYHPYNGNIYGEQQAAGSSERLVPDICDG